MSGGLRWLYILMLSKSGFVYKLYIAIYIARLYPRFMTMLL